jgi:predicted aspartyl protease
MGTFYIGCKVENHKDPKRAAVVPKLLVDTGSEFTWLPEDVLKQIGVQPVKKDLQIQMANGQSGCGGILIRCSVRARWTNIKKQQTKKTENTTKEKLWH